MKVSLIFAVILIILDIGNELQAEKQPTDISKDNNSKGNRKPSKEVTKDEICNEAKDVSVQSVFVSEHLIQLFIENMDGSKHWTAYTLKPTLVNAKYVTQRSQHHSLGRFWMVNEIRDLRELKDDGKFKSVSASFVHFSNCVKESGYLVGGLTAHEFVIGKTLYFPTRKVRPITDFFKEIDKKLLMPEDKLEVVSVALIKWIEKDKAKDHAIYKIILKTVTKKLVKAYFKQTSTGEVISLNSEPFVSLAEDMQVQDEFGLLEEAALYYVGEKGKLSVGYQFTKTLAFPIYYDYNPDTNTYKEYAMRTKEGFNADLENAELANRIPYWNRYMIPTKTWLGCPETTSCLGPSFDVVFSAGNQYYAIIDRTVYTLESTTSTPGIGQDLLSLFPIPDVLKVDAAFSLGAMLFFIQNDTVYYITDIGGTEVNNDAISSIFPGIDFSSHSRVSAVITLDKGQEAGEVTQNVPEPSHLKSARLRKYHRIHERAAKTAEEDIPKKMVYVYFSTKDAGIVYQFEVETMKPPKFKLMANKTYNDVNAALPLEISLAFTADDKVVTMVHHFMIVQSSLTFFTKTESIEKFTLVDKYFGCKREEVEKKLTKEFVQNYVKFAGPKPGVNVLPDPGATQGTTESGESGESTSEGKGSDSMAMDSSSKDSEEVSSASKSIDSSTLNEDEEHAEVKSSAISAQISTAGFIIQAIIVILFVKV